MSYTHQNPVTLVKMSSPTRDSQERLDKAAKSLCRIRSFQRTLLALGGLTKHQRRSVVALVQEFWLDNANHTLEANSTHMNDEAVSTHNDATTSRLTNTDTDCARNLEQRSQNTTTPVLQNSAIGYFDIYESSETDLSNDIPVMVQSNSNAIKTSNRFADLEILDTDSEDEDEMSVEDTSAIKDEEIRRLEQELEESRLYARRNDDMLRERYDRLVSVNDSLESQLLKSKTEVGSLKNQVDAQTKELTQRYDTETIDFVIRKHFPRLLSGLTYVKAKEELKASMRERNPFLKLLSEPPEPQVNLRVYNKTCLSLLKSEEINGMLRDEIKEHTLVPVNEIECMEKAGKSYELHLEIVLDKLIRAALRKMETSNPL